MAASIGSEGLREFLRQELEEDSNATIATARVHLEALCESGPSDSISTQEQWLVELTELNEIYNDHTPLADLLAQR